MAANISLIGDTHFTAIFFSEKRQKQTLVTCLKCGNLKRFVYNPKQVANVDQPDKWEAVVLNGQVVAVRKPRQKQGKQKQQNHNKTLPVNQPT